eukprot:TRINITY_DN10159_c0_g1_i1.p3 TRINITY_DN10159_c0_g1~~TRINITY_DN10159_c0_g1_i1.p3  ORF type:complete len:173 (+),score=50.82 TRINITY_DN10159_c0_g1_i1:112-630(+)
MEGRQDCRISQAVKIGICTALKEIYGPWFDPKLVESRIQHALDSTHAQLDDGDGRKQETVGMQQEANGVVPQETPPQTQEVKVVDVSEEEQQQSPQEDGKGGEIAVEVKAAADMQVITEQNGDAKKRKQEELESDNENRSQKKKSKKDKSKDKDDAAKSEKKKDKKKDKKKK